MPQAPAVDRRHNQPPSDTDILKDSLNEQTRDLLDARDELLDEGSRVPETIADDETCGRVSDFIKKLTAAAKDAEGRRTKTKEPFLASAKIVDGHFAAIKDPLDRLKAIVLRGVTAYLQRKEAAARAQAEAERRDAERLAKEAADRADRLARNAQTEIGRDVAADAGQVAADAAAVAADATKAATAKPAELSRTRGDYGSVASLRTEWTFESFDRATIDLNKLRPYLPSDAIDKAIRAFIKSGGRELTGTRIYETSAAGVR